MTKQFSLGGRAVAAGEAAKLSAAGNDPVTGDEDRYGVRAASLSDGRGCDTQVFGQFAVGSHFSERDIDHALANTGLEFAVRWRQR